MAALFVSCAQTKTPPSSQHSKAQSLENSRFSSHGLLAGKLRGSAIDRRPGGGLTVESKILVVGLETKMTSSMDEDVMACRTNAFLEHAVVETTKPCDRALTKNGVLPANVWASYYHRGLIFQNMGDTNAARQDFLKAASLKPELGESYLSLASLDFMEDDFENALANVETAMNKPLEHRAYA